MREVNEASIQAYCRYLIREEKSAATVEKYIRDVRAFAAFLGKREVTKSGVIEFKKHLLESGYAVRSINSMLASLNGFLKFLGRADCRVRSVKLQKQVYCTEERELTRLEYQRLLHAAKRQEQLWLVMQAICGTGIRVSELRFFTVEAVTRGEISVNCKAKTRVILIPGKLRRALLNYARKQKIRSGVIFLTRSGKPMGRKMIWAQMKGLCKAANVDPRKVFPHILWLPWMRPGN